VDSTDAANVAAAISEKTKLIWIESPTNPTLKISDLAEISKIAKAHGVLLCVDNTFASPAAQSPLPWAPTWLFIPPRNTLPGTVT
jgi:cystathionine beta-lyase